MTQVESARPRSIARYSVALFILLAVVLGGGTIFLVVQGKLPAGLALASVLSASTAGIILTAMEDGWEGLKTTWRRLLIWRVGIGYWLFAFLFILPVVLFGLLFNPFFNGDPFTFSNFKSAFGILPMFIIFVIVSGFGQELGWTGFLIARLQARFSALTSCMLRALLVSIWHLPVFLYSRSQHPALADFQYSRWIAHKGFLVAFITAMLLFQVPWSIFFTWLFNNTGGSLLLVAVLHGSEIWVAYLMMNAAIDPGNLDNYWGYGALLVLMAAVIVIINGPQHLSRVHKRVIHQPS